MKDIMSLKTIAENVRHVFHIFGKPGPLDEYHAALADHVFSEHDETPLTPADVPEDVKIGRDRCIDFEWDKGGVCHAYIRQNYADGYEFVELMPLKTIGQFRTFCRLLGIPLNEQGNGEKTDGL